MVRKRRNKMERLQSDEEVTTSDEEMLSLDEASEDELDLSQNVNNSNSLRTQDASGKNHLADNRSVNEKFLVTRSKRKYTKREVKLPIQISVKKQKLGSQKSSKISEPKCGDSSKQTTTEQNQMEKGESSSDVITQDKISDEIRRANDYLDELKKTIKSREDEIHSLKVKISESRNDQRNLNEGEEFREIESQNIDEEAIMPFSTDSMSIDEFSGQEAADAESEDGEKVERTNKRRRSRERDSSRKRRKSRSRSRSRRRHRSSSPDEVSIQGNPKVQKLVEKLVSEQVAAELARQNGHHQKPGSNKPTPVKLKSPSESTLYTPAVRRTMNGYIPMTEAWIKENRVQNSPGSAMLDHTQTFSNHDNRESFPGHRNPDRHDKHVDEVSHFLNEMRFNSGQNQQRMNEDVQPSTSNDQRGSQPAGQQTKRARSAAENAILDAERFKAQIQQPSRGKQNINDHVGVKFNNYPMCGFEAERIKQLRYLDSEDDEFFHTTCHIEAAIREKIEKGGYVDLEKLIQKRIHLEPRDTRLQLINKDGLSYFVPTIDRETKIDNIKKWEQAFRVYTTIYCNANPTRSGEILQYVDVIHRAASTFSWDNVARYDYVFRQLMAAKPHRSWAKVYTQMWNITLNEPLRKFQESNNHFQNRQQGGNKKRESVCWKFNKGNCTYGKSCKFEHKCSYCGGFSHGASTCLKKAGKKNDKGKNSQSTNKD